MSTYLSLQEINPCMRLAGQDLPKNIIGHKRMIYDYEFIYCHKGSFGVYYENHQVFVTSGEILIISPNLAHQLDYRKATEVYWVHFDFYYYDNQKDLDRYIKANRIKALSLTGYSKQLARPPIVIKPNKILPQKYRVSDTNQTHSVFINLIHVFNKSTYDWAIQSKCLINQLLIDTLKHLEDMNQDSLPNLLLVQSIRDYLLENVYRKVSSKELSNRFHYHSDFLNRLFKNETGTSIRTYTKEIRLIKVKKLLEETDLNLDHIANECGYTDRSHLIRMFKTSESMTPGQFRRNFH